MEIQYPTWRNRGGPTPCEKLVICDKCGFADWTTHGVHYYPPVCRNQPCNKNRLREATPAEYEAGKKALKPEYETCKPVGTKNPS